jgi:hypothetical protein
VPALLKKYAADIPDESSIWGLKRLERDPARAATVP